MLAALRALNTVADSLSLESPLANSTGDEFLGILYTDQHLNSIGQIIDQSSPSLVVEQQISLAAALITKTCQEEGRRKAVAQSGILEALATKLASYVIATGYALHPTNGSSALASSIIPPATTRLKAAPILQTIGTVIQNSMLRTAQFLYAQAFNVVFPGNDAGVGSSRTPLASPTTAGSRQVALNPIEKILHQTSDYRRHDSPAPTVNFPPLGALGTHEKQPRTARDNLSGLELFSNDASQYGEEQENPLIAWLVHVVRAESGVTRLMAAWVLTILYRSGLGRGRYETRLALLLVPLLVRMLDNDFKTPTGALESYDKSVLQSPNWAITEQAPAVLAMLIVDSLELQRAAVDAGAIKKLSQLLKQSYDPLPAMASSTLWDPNPSEAGDSESHEDMSATKLGKPGLSPLACHIIKMREAVLIALAATASLKDEYRKAIIDNGVVPFIIESLQTHDSSKNSTKEETAQHGDQSKNQLSTGGKSTDVLLAACGAARMLSRSVSTLRTSLIDAGLAAPLFTLLSHQDIEVQISATGVICNLVLEFSPMREVSQSCISKNLGFIDTVQAIIKAGILVVLCDHAHSMNARLRLNSVWALKHLVHTAPNSMKIKCLEELGPGWLKQIICHENEDMMFPSAFRSDRDFMNGTSITMGTPNAAGEQVDLLNAVEDESRDSSQATEEDVDDEVKMIDSIGSLSRATPSFAQNRVSTQTDMGGRNTSDSSRQRPLAIDNVIDDGSNQARSDDIAVQEQGLDFIRNLILGSGSSEMIDYLFRELGQDKLFDILATKLRPKIVNAFSRERRSLENSVKHVPPPTEIVISVCYIIVHIAAGLPKHRQLLIAQSELWKLLVPLFSHPHREVRCCCAWLVINLTWVDDQSDRLHCKARAHELRKMGVLEKLEALASDQELDVRERTKNALNQMSDLIQ